MTLRWRYEIHRKDVGRGSLESSGSVATVEDIAQIVKANHPQKKVVIRAPLDETRAEQQKILELNVERMFP
jgi:hypothetical protein